MEEDDKKAVDAVYDKFLARVKARERKQAEGKITLYMSDTYLMAKVGGVPEVVYRTSKSDLHAIME